MATIKCIEPDAAAVKAAKSWPTWGCEPSKFPWSYSSTETAYVVAGKVTVTPDGGEPVEVVAGRMYTFPKGMSCTWEVHETIKKHYSFED